MCLHDSLESLATRKMNRRSALRTTAAVGGAALALGSLQAANAQQPPTGTVRQLTADTYLWSVGGYNSPFVVTDAGVIATDPSSQNGPANAMAYKAAIASVTDQPVRYVVYSHDHADHNTGGAVFADTAQFVAHRRAAPKIAARTDGRSPVPTILVDNYMELRLGGKWVELHYTGRNHSDNSLVLRHPDTSWIYAVDFIPVNSLPFSNLGDCYLDEWKPSLMRVDAMNFNYVIPGHGLIGDRGWVRAVHQYFTDLENAIMASMNRGHADNSPEMVSYVRETLAPRYSTWASWQNFLPLNIQGYIAYWNNGVQPR